MIFLLFLPLLYVSAVVYATPMDGLPLAVRSLIPLAFTTGIWLLAGQRAGLLAAFAAGIFADCVSAQSIGPSAVCWLLTLWVVDSLRNGHSLSAGGTFLICSSILFAGQLLSATVQVVLSQREIDPLTFLTSSACAACGWALVMTLAAGLLRGMHVPTTSDSFTRADRWLAGGRTES